MVIGEEMWGVTDWWVLEMGNEGWQILMGRILDGRGRWLENFQPFHIYILQVCMHLKVNFFFRISPFALQNVY